MARVTVEDCIDKIDNRFLLVLMVTHRARRIHSGDEIMVDRDNDKDTVVALRELAQGRIMPEELLQQHISALQKHTDPDELDDSMTIESFGDMLPASDDSDIEDEEEVFKRMKTQTSDKSL